MPVYDFECASCGMVHEAIAGVNECTATCPHCGGSAKRIISLGGVNCANQDAAWLKSVTDIVNPDKNESSREFKANPTRANYQKWLKQNGLRPLENNERMTPEPFDLARHTRELAKRHRERLKIII